MGRQGSSPRYSIYISLYSRRLKLLIEPYLAGYGPSEMTNVCSVCPNIEAWHSPRNIGPPLKNTSVFLVSEHDGFSLTPRGAVGELCFGGDQVVSFALRLPIFTSTDYSGWHRLKATSTCQI